MLLVSAPDPRQHTTFFWRLLRLLRCPALMPSPRARLSQPPASPAATTAAAAVASLSGASLPNANPSCAASVPAHALPLSPSPQYHSPTASAAMLIAESRGTAALLQCWYGCAAVLLHCWYCCATALLALLHCCAAGTTALLTTQGALSAAAAAWAGAAAAAPAPACVGACMHAAAPGTRMGSMCGCFTTSTAI
eukprot:scaffold323776_cov18-Tisochrysis_lutea.AAC.3